MIFDARRILAAAVVAAAALPVHAQQPATTALATLSRELACAPASPLTRPSTPVTVVAGREARKTLFGAGDALVIAGGTAQGMKKGDEYFVRRIVDDRHTELRPGVFPLSISTAGFVQILEVQNEHSIAIVTFACDGIMLGDYLEPFVPDTLPPEQVGNAPDYQRPGRILLAAERRQMGAPGQFVVLDRGSDHGLRPGHVLTIFRRTVGGDGPVATIGTAKVYVVKPETSVVRIESSLDAVYVGDLVAIHR